MIARLSGILLDKDPPNLVIDVNGVAYEVEAPLGVFSDLPENGGPVAMLIHEHFSQDSQTLYGFSSKGERELFRKLLKISGIGAVSGRRITQKQQSAVSRSGRVNRQYSSRRAGRPIA